jgi:cytosine/adenosine deaminase-related metal-dependent hydrolase
MILKGASLLHLDPPRLEQADVQVDGTVIAAVDRDLRARADEQVVDLSDRWLMPGLCVAHHHLYSALACGMPLPAESPHSFSDMLAQVWWRLDRALDPESVTVSALVGGVQALRAGVTTIIDHHASPGFIIGSLEAIDSALADVGLRRILCYEVSDRGGDRETHAGLTAHEHLLASDGGGQRAVLIGAHANFTLSDDTLSRCAGLAREAGVGLHIHVAESAEDAEVTGEPLIARMERLDALLPGSIFAHCVHLSLDELQQVGDAGIWVTHQPRSNQNNGVGYAHVGAFPQNTALGTDGIGADLFAEIQAAWFRAQEGGGHGWSPARWLGALTGGARLAGSTLGVELGRITPGYQADLVVLDPVPGPPLRSDNLASAFLFRLSAAAVRDVMVAGEWRLLDRTPLAIDVATLDEQARSAASALWQRMR